jgi:hypothetical protein
MKLAGFLLLLAVLFLAAHAAGGWFGQVTTSHSQVLYTGGGSAGSGANMNGMNMNSNP